MNLVFGLILTGLLILWPTLAVRVARDPERTRREKSLLIRGAMGFELASALELAFILSDHLALLVAGAAIFVVTVFSFPPNSASQNTLEHRPDLPERRDDGQP